MPVKHRRHRVHDRATLRRVGASAFDLVVGLLLGNLLAVATWRFLTAEIATQKRLTLYYQLRRSPGAIWSRSTILFNGPAVLFQARRDGHGFGHRCRGPFEQYIKMPSFSDPQCLPELFCGW